MLSWFINYASGPKFFPHSPLPVIGYDLGCFFICPSVVILSSKLSKCTLSLEQKEQVQLRSLMYGRHVLFIIYCYSEFSNT